MMCALLTLAGAQWPSNSEGWNLPTLFCSEKQLPTKNPHPMTQIRLWDAAKSQTRSLITAL